MAEFISTQPVDDRNFSAGATDGQPKYFLTLEHNGQNELLSISGKIIIGRDRECSFFVDDSSLSRMHASIEVDENDLCMLTDLGSLNGSKRNGMALKPKVGYELRPGDRVQFGNLIGIIHLSSMDDPLVATQLSGDDCMRNPGLVNVFE
ncbi:Mediator of DNA damage checkpoint protein 1 [Clonorchis sinensis]|uniref:Mediator of DNA damage checkpoint protein 1 n=1 Tax=Clonorchis sinensis TaxID=79923 RepID=A0A8T1M537_CLOSI|nr:Mediator of DNA damage checkpoint protein 1 [Clonorchis sinensis]